MTAAFTFAFEVSFNGPGVNGGHQQNIIRV